MRLSFCGKKPYINNKIEKDFDTPKFELNK